MEDWGFYATLFSNALNDILNVVYLVYKLEKKWEWNIIIYICMYMYIRKRKRLIKKICKLANWSQIFCLIGWRTSLLMIDEIEVYSCKMIL